MSWSACHLGVACRPPTDQLTLVRSAGGHGDRRAPWKGVPHGFAFRAVPPPVPRSGRRGRRARRFRLIAAALGARGDGETNAARWATSDRARDRADAGEPVVRPLLRALQGGRGFGDSAPLRRRGGGSVFQQPVGSAGEVLPFSSWWSRHGDFEPDVPSWSTTAAAAGAVSGDYWFPDAVAGSSHERLCPGVWYSSTRSSRVTWRCQHPRGMTTKIEPGAARARCRWRRRARR